MLGELQDVAGRAARVVGSLAYVPQRPWIMSGTLRDNILFGRPVRLYPPACIGAGLVQCPQLGCSLCCRPCLSSLQAAHACQALLLSQRSSQWSKGYCVGAGCAQLEEPRYRAVLHACALEADLCALPAGDATWVGDRGATLSGGQCARLALARAIYQAGPHALNLA